MKILKNGDQPRGASHKKTKKGEGTNEKITCIST